MATSTKSKTTKSANTPNEARNTAEETLSTGAATAPLAERDTAGAATAPPGAPYTEHAAEKVDESQYVTVRNGFHGTLVYISPRTGEKFSWPEYGDEQEMELRELKGAKASQKAFFSENWFLLDDWVIRYLGVENYYRHAVDRRELGELLASAPDKIVSEISGMSAGQKSSVAFLVRSMVESGEIDSLRVITALEKALDIELIEK